MVELLIMFAQLHHEPQLPFEIAVLIALVAFAAITIICILTEYFRL
jgi:hypothetical protein